MSKFDVLRDKLKEGWGFTLSRNGQQGVIRSERTGRPRRYPGNWTTGYTLSGDLRGAFVVHFKTLKEVEKSY